MPNETPINTFLNSIPEDAMDELKPKIREYYMTMIREMALKSLSFAKTCEELENWRIRWLGKKGVISKLLKLLGNMTDQEHEKIVDELVDKLFAEN